MYVFIFIALHCFSIFCMDKPADKINAGIRQERRPLTDYVMLNYADETILPGFTLSTLQQLGITFETIQSGSSSSKIVNLADKYLAEIKDLANTPIIDNHTLVPIKDIGKFPQALVLLLGSNQLTDVTGVAQIRNLTVLDLSKNRLRAFSSLDSCRALRILDLSFNRLAFLCSSIEKLRCLEELNVSNNELTQLPEEVGTLERLQTLNVSNNKLKKLPFSLCQLGFIHFDSMHNPFGANNRGNPVSFAMLFYNLTGRASLHDKKCFQRFMKQKLYSKAAIEWYQWGKTVATNPLRYYSGSENPSAPTAEKLYEWLIILLRTNRLAVGNPLDGIRLSPDIKRLILSQLSCSHVAARYLPSQGVANPLKQPLCTAAQLCDMNTLEMLLHCDVSVDDRVEALAKAAESGHLPAVRALLAKGIVASKLSNAVRMSARNGNDRVLALLLDISKDKKGLLVALEESCLYGKSETVKYLISKGINFDHLIEIFVEELTLNHDLRELVKALTAHPAIVKLLLMAGKSSEFFFDAFLFAARCGNEAVVELFSSIAEEEKDKVYALIEAANNNHGALSEKILCSGLSEPIRGFALKQLIAHRHSELAQKAIALGCPRQVLAQALYSASDQGLEGVVQELITRLPDDPKAHVLGLHIAANRGHSAIVSMFISTGSCKQQDICSAFCGTRAAGHHKVAQFLWDRIEGFSGEPMDESLWLKKNDTPISGLEAGRLLRNLVHAGNYAGVRMFLTMGMSQQNIFMALIDAAAREDLEMVKLIIPFISQTEFDRACYYATLNGHTAIREILIRARSGTKTN